MANIKQVIVMRKDLNMRKGKIASQAAHASMAVILNKMNKITAETSDNSEDQLAIWQLVFTPSSDLGQWLTGSFTKICVSVDSEQELLDIVKQADAAGIPNALITDNGLTEFNGIPTNTCCAIGPVASEQLQSITGHLKLL